MFGRDDGSNDFSPFPIANGSGGFGVIRDPHASLLIDDAILGSEHAAFSGTVEYTYVGLAVTEKTLRIVFFGLVSMLMLVAMRAGYFQVLHGADYAAIAEGNRSRLAWVPAERGVMYDRRGKPLVRNMPDFSATLTLADLPKNPGERHDAITRISNILEVPSEDIEARLEEFKKYPGAAVIVGENIGHEKAMRIEVESATTPGIALETGMRREYLNEGVMTLSHVLGYQGRIAEKELAASPDEYRPADFIGKSGLEKTYESVMRGTSGKRRIEVDARGREKNVIADVTPIDGKNLVLTIDAGLQAETERIMNDMLKTRRKARASAIVMDPRNGDILALVSMPGFDANLFAQGINSADYKALIEDENRPLFPRAISGGLSSGSTFKPIVAAAALDEGIITPDTSVHSSGGLRIGAWFFPDWKAGGHGSTNVTKAIAESVNTFFYTIGGGTDSFKGLGLEKMMAYAKKFGLGSTLGIDLPGEAAGFLPSKEWKKEVLGGQWYIGDTYHIAIGQGEIVVTPLQIAEMTAVFANNGTMMRPRLVQAVTGADGARESKDPVVLATQVVSKNAIDVVGRGMRQTVTAGSARYLGDLPVQVAGKTGTAQWNSKKENHAWFTSFAPYENPEIVVTVVVEEGGEGSSISSPIAKEIYKYYFKDRKK